MGSRLPVVSYMHMELSMYFTGRYMTFIVSVVGLGKLALLQIHFIDGYYSYTTQLLVMERHNTVHHNGTL